MDTALQLHDVGVTLFYHIIMQYNDETAFYPPSKQLLTTCIETLGQVSVYSCLEYKMWEAKGTNLHS